MKAGGNCIPSKPDLKLSRSVALDTLNCQRRAKNRVTMLYKIINNQVTIDPNTYLNKSDTRTSGEHKYKQIATSKNIYKYSFFPPAPSYSSKYRIDSKGRVKLSRRGDYKF
jgi:hypothetical protein